MAENIRELLVNLQNDYGMRLDSKAVELANRLVMEHEERIKTQDDFKQQV